MPDTYVKLPNGQYVQVPEGASPEQLQQFKIKLVKMAGTQQAPQGPQQAPPLAALSQITGMSAAPGAMGKPTSAPQLGPVGGPGYGDVAQNLTQQGAEASPIQNLAGKAAGFLMGGNQGIGTEKGGILTNPITGTLLSAPMAAEAGSLVKGQSPSALRASAGETLGNIKSAAGKVPVNTSQFGDTLLELFTQDARGANMPTPVRKMINRITMPNKPPLTYEEAKDFQSNISNLLANPVGEEGARLKNPNTYRLVSELNQKLKASLEEASQMGGFNAGTFTGAMARYREAAQKQATMDRLRELAVKGAKVGAGAILGGASAGLGYDIYKLIHGEKK